MIDLPPAVWWVIAAAVGYGLGAINPAAIVARVFHVDLRATGSGNPGATNVGRALGPRWAVQPPTGLPRPAQRSWTRRQKSSFRSTQKAFQSAPPEAISASALGAAGCVAQYAANLPRQAGQ